MTELFHSYIDLRSIPELLQVQVLSLHLLHALDVILNLNINFVVQTFIAK